MDETISQSEKNKISQEIETAERLRFQLVLGCQEKETAENLILRTLDELALTIDGDFEQKEHIEEVRRYIEILNVMSLTVLSEEENRLNFMIENLKDEADRIQEKMKYGKTNNLWN